MAEPPIPFKSETEQAVYPPEKSLALPFTPPQTNGKNLPSVVLENRNIQRILQTFKRHQQGTLENRDSISLPLPLSEYDQLWKELETDSSLRDYVEDKIR